MTDAVDFPERIRSTQNSDEIKSTAREAKVAL